MLTHVGPSIGFLFWNLAKKPLLPLLRQAVEEFSVDVVILAENPTPIFDVVDALNAKPRTSALFFEDMLEGQRTHLFHRLPLNSVEPVSDSPGISIRHIRPPLGDSILLVSAHFPSKLHRDETGQLGFAGRVSTAISEAETKVGHSRTILVGDLNMSPFEPGVVAANGLHSTMTRQVALKGTRNVDQQAYPYFYNPMWGRFGDTTKGPPGTYYYGPAGDLSYFWHMFDQVLLRPALLPLFSDDDLHVVDKIGNVSLLNKNGQPDQSIASDHLPLLFRLQLSP